MTVRLLLALTPHTVGIFISMSKHLHHVAVLFILHIGDMDVELS